MISRKERMLGALDLARLTGAEIGPLDKPLVARGDSRVIYIDHKDAGALRRDWAADSNVDVNNIQVDAVWGERTLQQAIATYAGQDGTTTEPLLLDYVVASHVIEHVPDLVTWLQEVRSILKPGGEVRLALPDRRFTFDYLRRTSGLPAILAAYLQRARVPSAQCILDFGLHMAPVDCTQAWQGNIDADKLQRRYTAEEAMRYAREADEQGTYYDVHCWVFTPKSFATLCLELSRQDLLDFACAEFHDTAENEFEFFVALRASTDLAERSARWQRMAASAPSRMPMTACKLA